MARGKFVAYFRVSTDRQGRSGLGLEAQKKAVTDYLDGGRWELIGAFTEVESGKRTDRPELARALEACRKHKAALIIAKLDRLARDARLLLTVVDGAGERGVVFCDLPQIPPGPSGRFIVTLLAAVAELEAGLISQRTKAALAAAKARGRRLGWANPKRTDQKRAMRRANAVVTEQADRHAANVLPIVKAIRASGVTTLAGVAEVLNTRGVRTARGGQWWPASVRNLLQREAA